MKDFLFRWIARIFVPAWAKEMEQEGVYRLRAAAPDAVDESEFILVEDHQADITIFVFSGLDGLFGGGRRFEFQRFFSKLGRTYNLVFVRELRGYFYHLTPEGKAGGLKFYEDKVREVKRRLGASRNIAIGFSAGGAAAFYFGTRCEMDKVVGFCPSFPVAAYVSRAMLTRHLLNIRKLVTDLRGYVDLTVVSIWGLLANHRLHNVVRPEDEWDVMTTYRNCPGRRPLGTVVYGAKCQQDSRQAAGLVDLPEIKLRPVPTSLHNVPGELKKRGELAPLLVEEIQEVIAAASAESCAVRVAAGA